VVVGDAAKRCSIDPRARLAELPWCEVAGVGDRPGHRHDVADGDIIGSSLRESRPGIVGASRARLAELARTP
jgi:uncharacterized protein with HEPN domain